MSIDTRVERLSLLLLAVPCIVATAWMLVVAVGERIGRAPFAAPRFRNSAEAAAAGDAASMLRLIRLGDNPTRIHHVRPDLISSGIVLATTLEAAIWSRRIEMIRLLEKEGAIIGADQRRELACLAFDIDLPEVVSHLSPGVSCVRGAAVERIGARSRPEGAGDK